MEIYTSKRLPRGVKIWKNFYWHATVNNESGGPFATEQCARNWSIYKYIPEKGDEENNAEHHSKEFTELIEA